MFATIAIAVLASIGAIVVGVVLLALAIKFVDAVRQSARVAEVYARMRGKRYASLRERWGAFKYEMGAGYTSLEIGVWSIPHNPSLPIRRRSDLWQ